MTLEERLFSKIKDKGIMLTVMAEKTGISYNRLYSCSKGRRALRIQEYFDICEFVNIDPTTFHKLQSSA